MSGFEDFDRYCDEREAAGDMHPDHVYFGQWLADQSGRAIMSTVVGDVAPEAIFLPDTTEQRSCPT